MHGQDARCTHTAACRALRIVPAFTCSWRRKLTTRRTKMSDCCAGTGRLIERKGGNGALHTKFSIKSGFHIVFLIHFKFSQILASLFHTLSSCSYIDNRDAAYSTYTLPPVQLTRTCHARTCSTASNIEKATLLLLVLLIIYEYVLGT